MQLKRLWIAEFKTDKVDIKAIIKVKMFLKMSTAT